MSELMVIRLAKIVEKVNATVEVLSHAIEMLEARVSSLEAINRQQQGR